MQRRQQQVAVVTRLGSSTGHPMVERRPFERTVPRALGRSQELVGGGRMTNRQFHDAVITGGHMPVEMIRVRLRQVPLTADFTTRWRFDAGLQPGTTP